MLHTIIKFCIGFAVAQAACPDFSDYSKQYHPPFSSGRYNLSYQRPTPDCRTASSPALEAVLTSMQSKIADPDLYRLFLNSYPNTLDTAVKWQGYAANDSRQELAFIITGDINAMWLRDSANQLQSYLSLLSSSVDVFASLFRGVINLQSRYLLISPFCNSFQPPVESGIAPSINNASLHDVVYPNYTNTSVFECKYELDSLAAFLQISTQYYSATNDSLFFSSFQWSDAVRATLNVAQAMRTPTYAPDGSVNKSPYSFQRLTTSGSETLTNKGTGNPVANGTGLVRSAFRPSDDACIYQLFIPANIMFANYLSTSSSIATAIGRPNLAAEMSTLSAEIFNGISAHAITLDPVTGQQIYAYEIDGFGSMNIMDDANIPSLLSAPLNGYTNPAFATSNQIYKNTRANVLSTTNPYFMHGPVLSGVGGPHDGPGYAWPMSKIVEILTSQSEDEIALCLKELVSSTDGLGLIHESINTFNQSDWTRQWFSWANGLFGQAILGLEGRGLGAVLQRSYQ